jgi:acyl-CoA thioesterase I
MRSKFILAILTAASLVLTGVLTACKSTPSTTKREQPASGSVAEQSQPSTQPGVAPPAVQPVPALPDSRPIVVTFGDSLTQGVSGKSYPAFLQDLLDKNGYPYRVDNQGVSGDTTTDGAARIENVVVEKPALVVLEFGGNDGLRGVPVESTKENLDRMMGRLREAGIPFVLAGITLPPNYGPDYVKPFTAIFPELAKEYKVPFLPFLLIHEYNKPNLMQPDGIHPNEEGNKLVAQDVFQLIRPLLHKRLVHERAGRPDA